MRVVVVVGTNVSAVSCNGVVLQFDDGTNFAAAAEFPDQTVKYADLTQPGFTEILSHLGFKDNHAGVVHLPSE